MNKKELKAILKPLIKECIKEVIFEEGSLSTIIKEVFSVAQNKDLIFETKKSKITVEEKQNKQQEFEQKKIAELREHKKKLLEIIGKDAFGGIDLFEGTTPLSTGGNPEAKLPGAVGPLSGLESSDPGVDISFLKNVLK